MKIAGLLAVIITGALLLYGTLDLPDLSDPNVPTSKHVSDRYIEKSVEETSVPNIVTSVLADYRGYDTMYETTVIFTSGIACFLLLRVFGRKETSIRQYRHIPTGITIRVTKGGKIPADSKEFERIDSQWIPYDIIIQTTVRLLIPFILLFAFYVIAHGHHSPGGGFQGGVILGSAVILYALSQDLRTAQKRVNERATGFMSTIGVFIYAGTGALCMLLGSNFLDYSALAPVLGVDPITARSHGILMVEIGVGVAVMGVMIFIYYILSSGGHLDEGL